MYLPNKKYTSITKILLLLLFVFSKWLVAQANKETLPYAFMNILF